MKKISVLLALIIGFTSTSYAQGGMWLPMLLKDNQEDMQSKGLKLSYEDIYSVDKPSVKDAVMLFGSGCTGEFVSNQGLVFTNHHCGYYQIVSHSTVEHDYLTNGFAAKDRSEEIPCQGLTVTLLQYMKDVTKEVLQGVTNSTSQQDRKAIVQKNIENILSKELAGTNLTGEIKPIYYGNQYIMYINKVYKDVRLVAAPPSNIGKFGGDTDNWMWPRHTGDFSVFRVYADENNEPKEYSPTNVPYKPKKFLKISLKDKQEGDFTFVMGYPGRTQQFLTSYAVEDIQSLEDPARIKIRTEILNVYNQQMNSSAAKRLRYASKVANIANGWKKWQGEVKGLKYLNAVERKQHNEQGLAIMKEFEKIYDDNRPLKMEYIYLSEAVLSSDFMQNAKNVLSLINLCMDKSTDEQQITKKVQSLQQSLQKYYDNDFSSHRFVDSTIFVRTMCIYYEDFAKEHYAFLSQNVSSSKSPQDYFSNIYKQSMLNNPDKMMKMLKGLKKSNYKKLNGDVAIELLSPLWGHYINESSLKIEANNAKLDSLYRLYTEDILNRNKDKKMFPDANLTLRVAYGNISSFKPKDAVEYNYYTTIKGIMEKEDSNVYDYKVEPKLKAIYYNNNMAPYGDRVAFIATNHTTGGNSGSPVMDANGNLIGLNFDRNWEGTMSDILYDKDLCRNITLDIRYCLLIIDKFLGAKNIIQELDIVE